MSFKGGEMVFGRRGPGVAVAVLVAALFVLSGLLAAPVRATHTDDIIVDFSVDVVTGECGEGNCPDGTRPVTFEPELMVDAAASRELTQAQRDQVNQILKGADVEVTVEVPGPDETVLNDETICLGPGQYDFTAEVVNETQLAAAIAAAIGDTNFGEEDLIIDLIEDDFVVGECPVDPDDGDGDINIDDRDHTNVCRNVVNIILENVQNSDVDNTQNAYVNVNNPPDKPVEAPLGVDP